MNDPSVMICQNFFQAVPLVDARSGIGRNSPKRNLGRGTLFWMLRTRSKPDPNPEGRTDRTPRLPDGTPPVGWRRPRAALAQPQRTHGNTRTVASKGA